MSAEVGVDVLGGELGIPLSVDRPVSVVTNNFSVIYVFPWLSFMSHLCWNIWIWKKGKYYTILRWMVTSQTEIYWQIKFLIARICFSKEFMHESRICKNNFPMLGYTWVILQGIMPSKSLLEQPYLVYLGAVRVLQDIKWKCNRQKQIGSK